MGLDAFATARAQRVQSDAAADVAEASQAVTDNNVNSRAQLNAIQAGANTRTTGGGRFGLNTSGRRGTLRLGGAFGGLAARNRSVNTAAKKTYNKTVESTNKIAAAQSTYDLTPEQADSYIKSGKIDSAGNFHF